MTVDTSAALGTVLSVLGSGQFPGVDLGVAPLPGLPGDGATFVGGGANYIVKGDDPAKVEAAWRFAKYLDEPETQAKWAQTGYIPIRQSAIDTPEVQQLWTDAAVLQGGVRPARVRQHDRRREGPGHRRLRRRAQGRDRRDGTDDDERGRARGRARGSGEERELRDQRLQRARRRLGALQRVTITQDALAPRPTVCASPTRAPATCRAPASPRSWCTSSTT